MPARRHHRLALFFIIATLGALTAWSVASPAATPRRTAQTGKLSVGVEVLKFSAAGKKLTGTGVVTARLKSQGQTSVVHTQVAVTAASGGGCRVLYLYLQQLNLKLLGLTAHLDKVQLTLTGQPNGGVLGSLFCKLAKAKVASVRASAAQKLTAQLERHRQTDVLRFSANLVPKATASQTSGSTCQVLDLIVGPLNLKLLGLVVNLNQVHLSVTATRGGGALGDLFCQLADQSPTTTGTTTT